jgi:hypothetical protein
MSNQFSTSCATQKPMCLTASGSHSLAAEGLTMCLTASGSHSLVAEGLTHWFQEGQSPSYALLQQQRIILVMSADNSSCIDW